MLSGHTSRLSWLSWATPTSFVVMNNNPFPSQCPSLDDKKIMVTLAKAQISSSVDYHLTFFTYIFLPAEIHMETK